MAGVGLIAAWLWIYRSVFLAGFVFEDHVTTQNARRWLTSYSWTIVPSALGSHLLSLGLWLALGAAVLVLFQQWGLSIVGQWAAAVIWCLHPLYVESVAYAASRGELCAALGVVSACACLAIRSPWRWLAVIVCALFAVSNKESGAVVVLVVPLVYAATARQWRTLALVCLASLAVFIVVVMHYGGIVGLMNLPATAFTQSDAIDWPSWALLQCAAFHHWLLSWITLQGIGPDIDVDVIPTIGRVISAGVLMAIALAGMLTWRRSPRLALGLLWTVVAVLPRLFVKTPQSYLNAHQMLVPSLGLLYVTALGWDTARLKWAGRV